MSDRLEEIKQRDAFSFNETEAEQDRRWLLNVLRLRSEGQRERVADALMSWWLSGTEDEDMRAWWSTQDASETALATADVILAALDAPG